MGAGAGSKSQDAAATARTSRLSQAAPLDLDRAFLATKSYTVSELLGQGGFGQVARGVHTPTGQEYVTWRCDCCGDDCLTVACASPKGHRVLGGGGGGWVL